MLVDVGELMVVTEVGAAVSWEGDSWVPSES